jgi:hypothetical protein
MVVQLPQFRHTDRLFRGTSSPFVTVSHSHNFLQLLRKEYIGVPVTPETSPMVEGLRVRTAVLGVIDSWIRVGGGALDILNNIELRTTVAAFLSSDIHAVSAEETEEYEVAELHTTYTSALDSLHLLVRTHLPRPPIHDDSPAGDGSGDVSESVSGVRGLPNIDAISVQALVDQIDLFAQTVLSPVLEEVHDLHVS